MVSFYEHGVEYVEKLNPPLSGLLKAIKKAGMENGVPIVNDEVGQFLAMICSIHRPKTILEVGCGISYSTHWMLKGYSRSRITALDANHIRLHQCIDYLKESNCINRVELIHGWADEFFCENSKQFDMIFLDSAKREYIKLMESCHKALHTGGILVADNIFFNGKVFGLTENEVKKYQKGTDLLKQFNEKIVGFSGFTCTFLPLSDGILVAQRIN